MSDRRCKCAIYQEIIELFDYYFKLNININSFTKKHIELDQYIKIVKLSVLGVEFRDKLL